MITNFLVGKAIDEEILKRIAITQRGVVYYTAHNFEHTFHFGAVERVKIDSWRVAYRIAHIPPVRSDDFTIELDKVKTVGGIEDTKHGPYFAIYLR